ncbi:hypothetical protein VK70_19975 [Paenibacillus durus ATCC 35681]|uniref:Uncharacterized protein n=1 Tax=Paenibacillus durus ATCC 35681 TaxID=1333534 RepID=A0A0F7FDF4_PAEDU|nr:hypothetical protein VK70_19975 [Paenibacillus durus ATCC 35681]
MGSTGMRSGQWSDSMRRSIMRFIAAQRMMGQRVRLTRRNRRFFPENLQVFLANFARENETDANVQLLEGCTPEQEEGM